MKRPIKSETLAVFAVNMLLIASIVLNPAQAGEALVRITTSFELKHTEAVLKRVAKVFSSGFERAEAEHLAAEIATMPADVPKSWEFTTLYKGSSQPLKVKALVDDLGMVDLDFATTAGVAPLVRAAVDGYLNSRNL
jgi:hypothetical protein